MPTECLAEGRRLSLLRPVFYRRLEHRERNILFRKMAHVERKQIGNLPYEIDARYLKHPRTALPPNLIE